MTTTRPQLAEGEASLGALLNTPPRAASFIVTLYGDVVEPRGGVLWMGTLIELCAELGISETLVRTAVSRLVTAGRLIGEREGRRSYYRLTPAARVEFLAAAQVLFAPPRDAEGWVFLARPKAGSAPALEREGFAEVGEGLWLGPDRPRAEPPEGLRFRAAVEGQGLDLPAFVAERWDLESHSSAYHRFIERFSDLARDLGRGVRLSDRLCLVARLILVDHYRAVLLRDPRLPQAALPDNWPGAEARALFAGLYLDLSAGADADIGVHMLAAEGLLPRETEATRGRLAGLELSKRQGRSS